MTVKKKIFFSLHINRVATPPVQLPTPITDLAPNVTDGGKVFSGPLQDREGFGKNLEVRFFSFLNYRQKCVLNLEICCFWAFSGILQANDGPVIQYMCLTTAPAPVPYIWSSPMVKMYQ